MAEPGIFTISLDFELYWGLRDQLPIHKYKSNLDGVPNAATEMLRVFQDYEVHVTWAIVGFLFFRDADDLRKNFPGNIPNYVDAIKSPYIYINESHTLDPKYHFAPELIELIARHDGQEIGTHTFSHYYCLEEGEDTASFRDDLSSAINIARKKNINLKSLVFPRNQFNPDYLPILEELGITCYRGNESGFMYAAVNDAGQNKLMRMGRLLDSYFNISGYHTYDIWEIAKAKPYDIPSSRFLRPFSNKWSIFENSRLNRIKNAMNHAARNGRLFHLWWHPHNFGVNTQQNISFLRKILDHFQSLKNKYGMLSLNMGEVAQLIELHS